MNNHLIEIVEIKRINTGNLKAYVSVQVGEWVIHDWKVVKKDGQKAWISPPQTSWRGPDGRIQYRALLSIPSELRQRIDACILSAWLEERDSEESAQ